MTAAGVFGSSATRVSTLSAWIVLGRGTKGQLGTVWWSAASALVRNDWGGPCVGCVSHPGGDGSTDIADLSLLLLDFGVCPDWESDIRARRGAVVKVLLWPSLLLELMDSLGQTASIRFATARVGLDGVTFPERSHETGICVDVGSQRKSRDGALSQRHRQQHSGR